MSWKKSIDKSLQLLKTSANFNFNSPAAEFMLVDLKEQFALVELPDELNELYRVTNGINELLDGGEKIGELIWPIDRVIDTNKEYRSHPEFKDIYMSFNQLFFISDAGNGDLFGFVTLNGRFDRFDIFHWNHEDDSRTWIAANLTQFLEAWVKGEIVV